MSSEVDNLKQYFENQITKQFSNSKYKDKLNEIIYTIEHDNFGFIKGDNLYNRVCGKIVEDIVAVLYNLKHTNQYSNDFIINGEVYEFKTAFNGLFAVKFYFENDDEKKNNVVFYQDSNYLVASIKLYNNICDFTSIELYKFKKLKIENKIKQYVKIGKYEKVGDEKVEDKYGNKFQKYRITLYV